MIKVGLTGGIGSGKSLVAHVFSLLGAPVYQADEAGRRLTASDPQVIHAIRKAFGDDMYDAGGALDRIRMAEVVFNDPVKLEALNAIIHPAVARDFNAWLKLNSHVPYVVKEAAILFESGAYRQVDRAVTVSAPESLRIQRVTERDHTDEAHVRNRMRNQWNDEQREEKADDVIVNDGSTMLLPQILKIHENIIRLSNKGS